MNEIKKDELDEMINEIIAMSDEEITAELGGDVEASKKVADVTATTKRLIEENKKYPFGKIINGQRYSMMYLNKRTLAYLRMSKNDDHSPLWIPNFYFGEIGVNTILGFAYEIDQSIPDCKIRPEIAATKKIEQIIWKNIGQFI